METNDIIYIAGHKGLIGSAIVQKLKQRKYNNLLLRPHTELNLIRQSEVEEFFKKERPAYVILAAARVGGIKANVTYPAQFIYENLAIQNNVIHCAYLYGVKKLLFFASACTYPRDCPQPMREEYLLSGSLEPTNESYAVAKIAGIKLCQAYNRQYGTNFIVAVLTNAYGPRDNFSPNTSHVIPALIDRFHKARINNEPSVMVWGSGNCRREFIYVDDVAEAALFLMDNYNSTEIINLGAGHDLTIKELAFLIKEIVKYDGEVIFDASKTDGIPRKMLDISKLKSLGWQSRVSLKEGITMTYEWYKTQFDAIEV